MAYQRSSKKTNPLREFLFLIAAVVVGLTAIFAPSIETGRVIPFLGVVLFAAFVVGVLLYLLFIYKQYLKQKALRALKLSHIDEMTGLEFEKYVAALLEFHGYKTKMTPPSSDYGVDIIAAKNGVKTAVQVKRYRSKLDQKSIREAITGKTVRKYNCTEAMVVTNSTFTKAAKFLASESGCKLIDREELAKWILEFQRLRERM